jgi:ABC-type polysaccharide/polyol phosphate export permease
MNLPGRHFLRNLVERRALVAQLVRRDFRQRYVGSAGGWLWGIVHPLVQLGVWWFVFQVCLEMRLPPEAPGGGNYAMFVMAGYLPWMLFQETVTRSAGSLVEHANLITRTVFPSEVVAVSIFLSSLIHHLIGVALVLVVAVAVLGTLSPFLLLLPVYMFCVGLLGVGIGWVASSLHVYLRDTGQVLAVVMQVWMWLTPIMISADRFPAQFRFLIEWNPMAFVVDAYRLRLLTAAWPDGGQLGIIAAYACAVFVAGGLFFRHLKRGFADVL